MAKKIMIVEDEPALRNLYAELLEEYELAFAESGDRALDLLNHQNEADLYLLDIGLPDVNGLEVARLIREKHPQARLIIITGYPLSSLRREIDTLMPNAVLAKPFGINEFKTRIHRIMASG